MSQRYDVIIAGGGPAGATAAFFLGQAGRRVLVLEKEFLPRYKPCGGAVSARVLDQFPFSFEPVIQSRVNAISYVLGDKVVTIPVAGSSLRMVMREQFDAYLLEHVQADVRQGAGVRSVDENSETVRVETVRGERVEADYLVAADGANSLIARSLGLRRKKTMAGAIEVEAEVPEETLHRFAENPIFIFGEILTGYIWIFPKKDHLSIGIGGLKPRPGELQSVLERVMQRFGIPAQGQSSHGHPVPIYGQEEPLGTQRSLLVGDAAGLVDPFTGEGIRFAIKSGRLAAQAILSGLPESYTERVNQAIGHNLRMGNVMRKIFYPFQKTWFELALRSPAVSQALVDMFADRSGYGRLLLTIATTFPRSLFTKKIALEEYINATPAQSTGASNPVPDRREI
ncbi:MAG: geranylgeranyl reductase family protein [Anaerolineales bacterium]|jgi:geranylgeranyl reductase family protein